MSGQLRSASVQQAPIGEKKSEWDYYGAKLFPNVKGCGYPPVVVCADFVKKYGKEGYTTRNHPLQLTRLVVVEEQSASTAPPPLQTSRTRGSANRGGGGSSADDPDAETSISVDDKTCIIQRSTSRGLNALSDKLPNSGKGLHAQVIEMNDLNPQLRHPVDGDVFLPKRNNNCNPPPPHERNGPTNPAAKNKGGEPTLLGGFEETDF
ncbi:Protein tipE [Orchesella cincta]|uniref:Protein tipE n=1 Tax=Orchesella cincta TaxID=48709 RepID=A0A1D2MPE0_ORCCI|nr:Protein tipE [Orchesella cincta]